MSKGSFGRSDNPEADFSGDLAEARQFELVFAVPGYYDAGMALVVSVSGGSVR